MIPRKRFDIGFNDIRHGFFSGFRSTNIGELESGIARFWGSHREVLPALSVRSGFDALLTALNLECGSEVLVSALTIKDMAVILQEHGLIPVPVDLDLTRLNIDLCKLSTSVTPKTRAILVAHLFGSLVEMDEIVSFAEKQELLIIEDCAQAFMGKPYRGHSKTDVSMFSFGPIKTASALGGAVLLFRDKTLFHKTRSIQNRWVRQRNWTFQKRALKYALLLILVHPRIYGLMFWLFQFLGFDPESIIHRLARGFRRDSFFQCIRQRPSRALLSLLARRLSSFSDHHLEERRRYGQMAASLLKDGRIPGAKASLHTYWVFPYFSDRPKALIQYLKRHGFDATQYQSSMGVIQPVAGKGEMPNEAQHAFDRMVYLPVYPEVGAHKIKILVQLINAFEHKMD